MVDKNFLKTYSATLLSSVRRTKSLTPASHPVDQYRLSTHHKSVILLATLKTFPICLLQASRCNSPSNHPHNQVQFYDQLVDPVCVTLCYSDNFKVYSRLDISVSAVLVTPIWPCAHLFTVHSNSFRPAHISASLGSLSSTISLLGNLHSNFAAFF